MISLPEIVITSTRYTGQVPRRRGISTIRIAVGGVRMARSPMSCFVARIADGGRSAAEMLLRNPITGIAGCCAARAASGHDTAAPPSECPYRPRRHDLWR